MRRLERDSGIRDGTSFDDLRYRAPHHAPPRCPSALRPDPSTGSVHQVMVRRIERTPIFLADADRADFGARLAMLTETDALIVYAWALLPNHAHLLVPTGGRPPQETTR